MLWKPAYSPHLFGYPVTIPSTARHLPEPDQPTNQPSASPTIAVCVGNIPTRTHTINVLRRRPEDERGLENRPHKSMHIIYINVLRQTERDFFSIHTHTQTHWHTMVSVFKRAKGFFEFIIRRSTRHRNERSTQASIYIYTYIKESSSHQRHIPLPHTSKQPHTSTVLTRAGGLVSFLLPQRNLLCEPPTIHPFQPPHTRIPSPCWREKRSFIRRRAEPKTRYTPTNTHKSGRQKRPPK